MSLEENREYYTICDVTVQMKRKIYGISKDFSSKIMEILGITTEEYFDNLDKIEKHNHILFWLTNVPNMPEGYWHQETGKCLGWEIKWVHQGLDDFIKNFDIINENEFNIASNSENFIEAWLSNLSHYPFDFNWIYYASVEAFWQSLKFKEWSPEWFECLKLFWVESKKYWKKSIPEENFIYLWTKYKVWSKEHQQLMKMALREQLKQNKDKLNLLLLTGDSKLIHQPKKKDGSLFSNSTTISGEIFSGFLMELREEFKSWME